MTTPLPKGSRILGKPRETLAKTVRARYRRGESIREIAEDLGRSYGFIHRLLVEMEVPLRGRGGDTRSRKAQGG